MILFPTSLTRIELPHNIQWWFLLVRCRSSTISRGPLTYPTVYTYIHITSHTFPMRCPCTYHITTLIMISIWSIHITPVVYWYGQELLGIGYWNSHIGRIRRIEARSRYHILMYKSPFPIREFAISTTELQLVVSRNLELIHWSWTFATTIELGSPEKKKAVLRKSRATQEWVSQTAYYEQEEEERHSWCTSTVYATYITKRIYY